MKKILMLFSAILLSMAGVAQFNNPTLNFSIHKDAKKQSPFNVKENSMNSRPGVYLPKFNGDRHACAPSPDFDPGWANSFQTALDSIMEVTNSKGASLAVYSPEYGMWTGVSGISQPGVPITSDMRFGIGSNTKLFIAVTMVKLQEEGILTLDDHLYQWLPPIEHVDSAITIRQLLSHESGLFDIWNDNPSVGYQVWTDTSRFWTTQEMIEWIGPPHFTPGNGYSYSNTNYLLAGMIIEAATGKTWVEKLHDFIFDPLNLDSTFVGAYEPRNGPCSAEWDRIGGVMVTNVPMTAEYSQANAFGAILATATEMVQWYNALFNGGVLSDSSMQQVLSIDPSSWYGLGIIAGPLNQGFYNHTGGMFGFGSLVLYDIQTQAIICMLFNDRDSDLNAKFNAIMNVFYNEYPLEANDAGIAVIENPMDHSCNAVVTPVVELVNYGNNPITSVSIQYKVDAGETLVFNWIGLLNSGESENVNLPELNFSVGLHSITVNTSQPNGEPEGHIFNDMAYKDFIIEPSEPVISELFEGFEGDVFPPEGWTVNPVSLGQWGITPLAHLQGGRSLARGNYNDMWGSEYEFELPEVNISGWYNTDFKFDYAYKMYLGVYGDSLQVAMSRDCGETWTTLFNKGAWGLATVSGATYDMFYPESPDDWKRESFPLSYFEGPMLIRFRCVNGYGNNLYIDNINIDLLTGTQTFEAKNYITVYPNPSTGLITISLPENSPHSQLTILNLSGQELLHQITTEPTTTINVSALPPGVYFVRLQNEKTIQTGKFIKQ